MRNSPSAVKLDANEYIKSKYKQITIHAIIQNVGVSKNFDQKYSNTVKYYYNLTVSISLYLKFKSIPVSRIT